MRCELSPIAEFDLEEIGDYIARDNPSRAVSFVREIRAVEFRGQHECNDNGRLEWSYLDGGTNISGQSRPLRSASFARSQRWFIASRELSCMVVPCWCRDVST